MTEWLKNIKITDVLERQRHPEESEAEHVSAIARDLYKRLQPHAANDSKLAQRLAILNRQGDISCLTNACTLLSMSAEAVFNAELDRIYAWADERKIWLD